MWVLALVLLTRPHPGWGSPYRSNFCNISYLIFKLVLVKFFAIFLVPHDLPWYLRSMTSYPTTRLGKIHIRTEAGQAQGQTLCGRLASGGASLSFNAAYVATCVKCVAVFETAANEAGEASKDPLIAYVFRQ